MTPPPQTQRPTVWTIQRLLNWTREYFTEKGIDTARLDAELLLSHVLHSDRVYLYTHFDKPLDEHERAAFRALVKRRAQREPIAYILGEREFFGRAFSTTPHVLIPRPETEHLIENAVPWLQTELSSVQEPSTTTRNLRGIDIGTGSGCIAISLLCEVSQLQMLATDVSHEALSVARGNAEQHRVIERIEFRQGDLLEPVVDSGFDFVVSNPPYIEDTSEMREELDADVLQFEPHEALFAGSDGLTFIRRLLSDVPRVLRSGGLFLCEFGHAHGDEVLAFIRASSQWSGARTILDLQGYVRAVAVHRV